MSKFKLVCLGEGTALDTHTFDTNFLLVYDADGKHEEYLALDVGRTWPEAIRANCYDWKKVTGIFISHLHADHIGGLEWLGFSKFFKQGGFQYSDEDRNELCGVPSEIRPMLYGSWEVIEELWNHSLRGGMESMQGRMNTLETYFQPFKAAPFGSFSWNWIQFDVVPTVHVVDQRRINSSAGLSFSIGNKRIFWTGDTQFCPHQSLSFFYDNADIIFHDCEMANYPNSVHAQYHELCTLPKEIRNKMWLMHHAFGEFEFPKNFGDMGFLGFVEAGHEFEF